VQVNVSVYAILTFKFLLRVQINLLCLSNFFDDILYDDSIPVSDIAIRNEKPG
jgi:hypothetical protein